MSYSDIDKLYELEREIAMRKRVYPAQIAKGSLSETAAARQLSILRAVAEDYRAKVVEGHSEPSTFVEASAVK